MHTRQRILACCGTTLLALCACAAGGCHWLTDGSIDGMLAREGTADRSSPGTATISESDLADVRAVLAESAEKGKLGRGGSVWIRAIDPALAKYHWRYPNLEEVLARPPEQRPRLRDFLADKDLAVSTNAAIGLARWGDAAGEETLVRAVRAPRLPVPMRCAAVEALASLPTNDVAKSLDDLLAQYGRLGGDTAGPYIADVHAELIRGLARHVDAADDPHFLTALRSPADDVKIEALRAWAASHRDPLPTDAVDLRSHNDARVRATALEVLAARRHPQAVEYLTAALKDFELRVHVTAITCLGEIGGEEAVQALGSQVERSQPERIRAAAVTALARAGVWTSVWRAVDDPAWRVRLKVAEALATCEDPKAIEVAGKLLEDPSAAVERGLVMAVGKWPVEKAGPLLLTAMGRPALAVRKTAAERLAALWPPAAAFTADGPQPRRDESLAALQSQFRQEHATTAAANPAAVRPAERTVAQNKEIAGLVDTLRSPEVSQRRRAADRLAEIAAKQTLPPEQVERIAQAVEPEADPLVWRSALLAANNGSAAAAQLAYVALSHPSDEVRRRGCELLAAHPHPDHAAVLLPTLKDANPTVVCAALRALGGLGHLANTAPLRQLLASKHESVCLEAALALARLGDAAGGPALQRLAYSRDAQIQRQAAIAMGDLGDPAFVPTLVHLLDAHLNVQRAALESLPKVVGRDMASVEGPPENTSDRVRRWKQWYGRQQQSAAAVPAARSPHSAL